MTLIKGYKILDELGEGSFGHVFKVEKKKKFYALKLLSKKEIIERSMQ